jgi:hypothetical protein
LVTTIDAGGSLRSADALPPAEPRACGSTIDDLRT